MALHNLATDPVLQIEASKRIRRVLPKASLSRLQISILPIYRPTNKARDLVSTKAEVAVKPIA